MKLFSALLISSTSAACPGTSPDIAITGGNGSWVPKRNRDGIIIEGNFVIECENGAATPAVAKCRSGKKWVTKGYEPAHCFEYPDMPDFLESEEMMGEDTAIRCQIAGERGSGGRTAEPRPAGKAMKEAYQTLYVESLKYLEGYARALTESDGICRNSDNTMTQTNTHTYGGPEYMCIMDRRDMRVLVKHIYFILYHPIKARRCFHGREDVGWMYGVDGSLADTPVAKWMKEAGRKSLSEFYKDEGQVPNAEVRKYGEIYAENFSKQVTGNDMQVPDAFPFDITANALPNLWSSAGWVPMYAWDSDRNKKNFIKTRGSYGYAEVLGHWGLIRIDSINRVPVGAEIGMVNQGIDTFYPFHNHAIPEIYYTIRKPKCLNEFNNFAIRENNPLLKTLSETDHMREVQFDGSHEDADHFWVPTSPKVDDLIYFHENTIHAFEINGEDCHDEPEEKAIVTVWARSMAHDRRNDYGTTLLCESDAEPETPAMKDDLWRCDLTKTKWRRSARSVHNPFEFNHH